MVWSNQARRALAVSCVLLSALLYLTFYPVAAQNRAGNTAPAGAFDSSLFKGLQWRLIGPYRGGRSVAVAGVPSQPMVYYFGATGGGLWKTIDGGVNWLPVSDGQPFGTGTVGAIAVSDSDPNVVYVGMGETPVRGNVSHGDGVYKSTDAGKTWKRMGLEDTRQIAKIRVDPRNPDIVYVGALGHIFGPNEQRGIFRSKDGGKTWERILYRNEKVGAIDLALDPTNANVLYAGFWDVIRRPWTLESGGPGSGIFKSTDGGDTWTEITRNEGLPKGTIGKVGIAISPVNPERVWALVEAEDGGVFRSDDGGKKWSRVNEERKLRQRAWYYTNIYADPKNADTVYVLNTGFYRSNDGGKTFNSISVPHGDNHDLWIAPNDPQRMINSNDGGANVSFNGGKTWTEQDQPTAQFYRVAVDNDFPYHIYGAQQDNSTVRIASRTNDAGIARSDWYDVGGGESGWIAPYPKDSEIVFAGSYGGLVTRYDNHSKQLRDVSPWPDNPMGYGAGELKYRFQWNFPILFSPHDPDVLYAAGNVLFKSTNQGQSWEVISPDLTRNDKSKQDSSGGPITKDNTSIEYYDTIFTVNESPVKSGVIWAGSDDGLVHVTRDGGKKWDDATPKGIPEWIQINSIDASPFDAGTAYLAATMYKSDDFRPFLYKTTDFGKTWTKITNGIPETTFTRVIREDPNKRGLLYAGTETGIYVSFDDGLNWQSLQLNLPVVPIADLVIHKREMDLVAATQGRAFWILDDLAVLHQMADAARTSAAFLLKPEDAYRMQAGGSSLPETATIGRNPSNGVVVYYYLKNKPSSQITLEFTDPAGKTIRKLTSKPIEKSSPSQAGGAQAPTAMEPSPEPAGEESEGGGRRGGEPRIPAEQGMNRFVWDMREAGATTFPGMILWGGELRGPIVMPGSHTVKLTVDGATQAQSFEVKKDPRVSTRPEEFMAQHKFLVSVRDRLTDTHNAILQIRTVRSQVDDLLKRLKDDQNAKPVIDAGMALNTRLTAIEEALYQTKNRSSQDPLNYPIRLDNKLAELGSVAGSADGAPTAQSLVVYDRLMIAITAELEKLKVLMDADLPAFNRLVRDQNVPAVIVKPSAQRTSVK